MSLSIIVAMDRNRVIGIENRLPWHLPADLARFKALTTGHCVIMGRRTFESIGRPLPRRTNIVVTRQPGYAAPGCTVVHSLEEAIRAAGDDPEPFVIGGGEIFREALARADKLYVTRVDAAVERGDAFFPELSSEWRLAAREPRAADDQNRFALEYLTYVRVGC